MPPSTDTLRTLLAGGFALCASCSHAAPTAPTASRATEPPPPASAPATPSPEPAAPALAPSAVIDDSTKSETFGVQGSPDREAPPAPAEVADKPEEDRPARDFKAELEHSMGHAASCLAPRAGERPPGAIDIGITANVMPSGAVRHGEVDARGLQPEERDCLQRQLESLHFEGPIENAPLSVHTTLQAEPPWTRSVPADKAAMAAAPKPFKLQPGETPGVVPPADPGVVPPEDPGVVPPADPGVVPPADPGVVPPADPPAYVLYPDTTQ